MNGLCKISHKASLYIRSCLNGSRPSTGLVQVVAADTHRMYSRAHVCAHGLWTLAALSVTLSFCLCTFCMWWRPMCTLMGKPTASDPTLERSALPHACLRQFQSNACADLVPARTKSQTRKHHHARPILAITRYGQVSKP